MLSTQWFLLSKIARRGHALSPRLSLSGEEKLHSYQSA